MATPLRSVASTALRQARACKPSGMRTFRSALLVTKPTTSSRSFTATAAAATSSSPSSPASPASPVKTLIEDRDSGFGFVRHNPAPPKPRTRSVTEIRGPYYTVMGPRYLSDVLETMGPYVDGLKFAGGSFSLFSEGSLRQLIDLAHANGVYVSTGGWIEHILASSGGDVGGAVDKYLAKCKDLGFDVIELSTGFLSLPPDDWLRLAGRVHDAGLEPKPELGIQFGAGGDTAAAELESLGTSDPSKLINMAERFLQAGVERVMIESEGITENVKTWRTDVIHSVLSELSFEEVMFEAADPAVFNWYIREFGVDVNLFVDHSQIVQLAGLRAGIWGKSDTFGKITTFRP